MRAVPIRMVTTEAQEYGEAKPASTTQLAGLDFAC